MNAAVGALLLAYAMTGEFPKGPTMTNRWTKSSFSADNGACVEAAYHRVRCDSGACVEAHRHAGEVHVRDSKNPDGPHLTYTEDEWRAFVLGVRAGELTFGIEGL